MGKVENGIFVLSALVGLGVVFKTQLEQGLVELEKSLGIPSASAISGGNTPSSTSGTSTGTGGTPPTGYFNEQSTTVSILNSIYENGVMSWTVAVKNNTQYDLTAYLITDVNDGNGDEYGVSTKQKTFPAGITQEFDFTLPITADIPSYFIRAGIFSSNNLLTVATYSNDANVSVLNPAYNVTTSGNNEAFDILDKSGNLVTTGVFVDSDWATFKAFVLAQPYTFQIINHATTSLPVGTLTQAEAAITAFLSTGTTSSGGTTPVTPIGPQTGDITLVFETIDANNQVTPEPPFFDSALGEILATVAVTNNRIDISITGYLLVAFTDPLGESIVIQRKMTISPSSAQFEGFANTPSLSGTYVVSAEFYTDSSFTNGISGTPLLANVTVT